MAQEDLLKRITARPDVFGRKPIIRACIAYAHAVIAHDSLHAVEINE